MTERDQAENMEQCPLHFECERYLSAEACEYRSGLMTYEEAEAEAYRLSGQSACDGVYADNH